MGYIGSHTAVTLMKAGHEVTSIQLTYLFSVLQSFEKITHKKIPYEVVARREGDLPAYYSKPDLANKMLHWKTKRTLESMCESAWEFKKKNFL